MITGCGLFILISDILLIDPIGLLVLFSIIYGAGLLNACIDTTFEGESNCFVEEPGLIIRLFVEVITLLLLNELMPVLIGVTDTGFIGACIVNEYWPTAGAGV